MAWTNPPPAVVALRDMLLLCASITGAGLVSARFHYPAAAITAENAATADTLPLCEITETAFSRQPLGDMGAGSLPSGELSATIFAVLSVDTLENLVRNVASELLLLSVGLPITAVSVSLSSEPSPGARAAAEDGDEHDNADAATITIDVSYGLGV